MDEKKEIDYSSLLNNLRIIGGISNGEFVGTIINNDGEYDIYCRYSGGWWKTLSDTIRLEKWNSTCKCLKKIYCNDLPIYIGYLRMESVNLDDIHLDRKWKIHDLIRLCKMSLKGLNNLKKTFNIAYQTKKGGLYDPVFDTIIKSYAEIQIKYLKNIEKKM